MANDHDHSRAEHASNKQTSFSSLTFCLTPFSEARSTGIFWDKLLLHVTLGSLAVSMYPACLHQHTSDGSLALIMVTFFLLQFTS